MRNLWTLLLCCTLLPMTTLGQNSSTTSQSFSPWRYPYTYRGDKAAAIAAPIEIAVDYSYLRANQSPGQCGCFSMNGGNAEIAFHNYRWFSTVADVSGARTGSIDNGSEGLSLISYTAGPRFTYPIRHRYAPFAQALFGGVHGFDSYFPVASGSTGAANGFAMLAGGGLDLRVKSYMTIRAMQADYFLMHLPNGVNNRQNNLRLSAGIVFRFW
ncbi:MAG: hypothetical protein WA634_03290 [Silvibacterium sp.]